METEVPVPTAARWGRQESGEAAVGKQQSATGTDLGATSWRGKKVFFEDETLL